MLLLQLSLCHTLLISTMFFIPEAITVGCDEWRLQGTDEICCNRCSPGNHLVKLCGRSRFELCTPCEPGTYTNHPMVWSCKRCTQCTDPQVQLKSCSSSVDTVCGCKAGFRCGDEQCSHCVEECTKGQEPTDERTCRKCPEGTFSDEIHSTCKPHRKSCPEGEHIIARGNEFRDINCSRMSMTDLLPEVNPVLKPTQDSKTEDAYMYSLFGVYGGISVLMIFLILLLWFAYKRSKNKINTKDPKPPIPTQGELTIMMVEHEEACSFHQPEQEQGGSSESISTQDSETKLIV